MSWWERHKEANLPQRSSWFIMITSITAEEAGLSCTTPQESVFAIRHNNSIAQKLCDTCTHGHKCVHNMIDSQPTVDGPRLALKSAVNAESNIAAQRHLVVAQRRKYKHK